MGIQSKATFKKTEPTVKKGDMFINKDEDMIYMVVETCSNNVPQKAPKAVCVWSDDEKNKNQRNSSDHVASIGEYRDNFSLVNWRKFTGSIYLNFMED